MTLPEVDKENNKYQIAKTKQLTILTFIHYLISFLGPENYFVKLYNRLFFKAWFLLGLT